MVAFAASKQSADDLLKHLLDRMHSMQANFQQRVVDSDNTVVGRASGVMYLQKPGKFRWQVEKPSQRILIVNGNTIWNYDVDLKQVTISTPKSRLSNNPAELLSGGSKLFDYVRVYHHRRKANLSWYDLVPLRRRGNFKYMQIFFRNKRMYRLILADRLGQRSDIRFTQIKINQRIPGSLFRFKPPPNVDVIKMASQ